MRRFHTTSSSSACTARTRRCPPSQRGSSVTVNSSRNTVSGRVPPGRRRRRQFITSGYLVEAASLEALAGKIGVDAAGLRETVRQHNRFAETGEDQEFGKGSTEFDRHNGDPHQAPNPCLGRSERAGNQRGSEGRS